MILGSVVLAFFLAFSLWPFSPKSRPALTEGPRLSAAQSDAAAFTCGHAEVFLSRQHVDRPAITITVVQRPPDPRV